MQTFHISADSKVAAIGRPFVLLFSAQRLVAGAAQVRFEILQPVAERSRCSGYEQKSLFSLLAPSLM